MRRLAAALTVALALVAALAAPASAAPPPRINLPNGWQPEGITAGQGTTIFVGSLADGSIWKGDVATGRGDVFIDGPGEPAVGIDYDEASDRLWVAGGATGEVRVYDASSGRRLRTYTFSPVGFLNDLVVTGSAVYVTDSNIQQLDVIPIRPNGDLAPRDAAYTRKLTGDIRYVANQFNGNGIVSTSGWLILVQTYTGQLFRVDPRTGVTREIDLGGTKVTFGDGLELRQSTLYVVRNMANRVAVLRLHSGFASAQVLGDLTSTQLDVPTTAAYGASYLWAVNARFSTTPTDTTPYWITRLPPSP